MIRSPTVLVLGAGASKPYGYPLGSELVDRIVSLTGQQGGFSQLFDNEYDVASFHERFRRSDPSSIDDFLESNPDLAPLGKLAIASALTIWGPTPDHKVDPAEHWYRYIWRQLHEGAATFDSFRENRLKIVTYNYDLSFERYLAGVVHHAYPTFLPTNENFVRSLLTEVVPVVHLHGDLGRADDEIRPHEDRGRFLDKKFVMGAAAGLQIIHEDGASSGYSIAHDWLQNAERIYLLGFGFHPTNCRRLDLVHQQPISGDRRAGDLAGTVFGLGQAEILRAGQAASIATQYLHNVGCLQFLRDFARLG